MKAVYLDELFFLNFIINYLLLLSAAMLSGTPLRRGRILLAAAIGAGYACLAFFPRCEPIFTLPGKAAVSLLLCVLAYGYESPGRLLRRVLVFYLVSFLFAGLMLLLFPAGEGIFYADLSTGVLLAAAAGGYALLTLLRGTPVLQEKKPPQVQLTLTLYGKAVPLTALMDTGNRLRDPVSNDRVLVVERRAVADAFPPGLSGILSLFGVSDAAQTLQYLAAAGYRTGFRLIPYSALGTAKGLLLAMRPERLELDGQEIRDTLLALTDTALMEETGCSAILGA